MSLIIDDDGTISIYQGDSGEIVVSGLDDTRSYTVYFAIQDSNRNLVGEELQVSVSKSDTVSFILTPAYTDLLAVPKNKPFEIQIRTKEMPRHTKIFVCRGIVDLQKNPAKIAGFLVTVLCKR